MFFLHKIKTFFQNPWALGQKIVLHTNWLWTDAIYLRLYYFFSMRKFLNLKKPVLFTEKLQWLKLYNRRPEYTTMVDKVAVKDYVAGIIGEKYIIPTLYVYDKVDDIFFDELPSKFVIKTSHGGGSYGVIVCKDKSLFDVNKAKSQLSKALKQDSYRKFGEWPYKNVRRRILVETYLEHESDLPDYKFYCFNGEPMYCQLIANRYEKETIDFYDKDWIHQSFYGLNNVCDKKLFLPSGIESNRPINYDEMLDISRKLSAGIPFVRVDLYNIEGRIFFGEMTFFPKAGVGVLSPEIWNHILGDMIKLPQ